MTIDRRRYARHLSLPEIGESGQERLQAARVENVLNPTTIDYLRRAGVVIEAATEALPHGTSGPTLMEGEESVLAGAWEAVERMKAILGIGTK